MTEYCNKQARGINKIMTEEEQFEDDFTLLSLPPELLQRIFTYLTFDETSQARLVGRLFDNFCRQRLNAGFTRAERLHSEISKDIKSRLPRRESERRNHALARHVDILSAVETRLSLLSMTYVKYIEMDVVCFVPGRVLDEMFHVLLHVRNHPNPPRAHELLQELRDISSMAMEHFDEKIVPQLKKKIHTPGYRFLLSSDSSHSVAGSSHSSMMDSLELYISKEESGHATFQSSRNKCKSKRDASFSSMATMKQEQELASYKNLTNELMRKLAETNRKQKESLLRISKQEKTLKVYSAKILFGAYLCLKEKTLKVYCAKVVDLSKRIFDYDQKFVDIVKELARVRGTATGDEKDWMTKYDKNYSKSSSSTKTLDGGRVKKQGKIKGGGADKVGETDEGSSVTVKKLLKRSTSTMLIPEANAASEKNTLASINTADSSVKQKILGKNGGRGSKGKYFKNFVAETPLDVDKDIGHSEATGSLLPDIAKLVEKCNEVLCPVESSTKKAGRKRKAQSQLDPEMNDIPPVPPLPKRVTRHAAAATVKRFKC